MSVLLLSGGLDSLVLLAEESAAGRKPLCLSFDYGQRHGARELPAAERIAGHYGCEWRLVTLPAGVLGGSALTGEKELPAGLPPSDPAQEATVVPGRNAVLLTVAAAHAARRDLDAVLYAANLGDPAVYADCRRAFVDDLNQMLWRLLRVRVRVPYLLTGKRDIVARGRDLAAPLDWSWSCYAGGTAPCGGCGACAARREAGA